MLFRSAPVATLFATIRAVKRPYGNGHTRALMLRVSFNPVVHRDALQEEELSTYSTIDQVNAALRRMKTSHNARAISVDCNATCRKLITNNGGSEELLAA